MKPRHYALLQRYCQSVFWIRNDLFRIRIIPIEIRHTKLSKKSDQCRRKVHNRALASLWKLSMEVLYEINIEIIRINCTVPWSQIIKSKRSNPGSKKARFESGTGRETFYMDPDQQRQCCGSMIFWSGSGSGDPCLWLMDPKPSIFVMKLQDANKKNYGSFFKKFFCLLLFEGTFTSFFKDKSSKRSHKTVGIKVFLTIFAWW